MQILLSLSNHYITWGQQPVAQDVPPRFNLQWLIFVAFGR